MVMQTLPWVMFFLLVGHALGDFVFQSEWMIQNKNHRRRSSSSSERADLVWIHVLGAHALIHGGAVALTTGMLSLGVAETLAHFAIDYGKSDGRYGFHIDQFLHLGCKVLWAVIWLMV